MINLFNQKTALHIFNGLNRGTGAGLPVQSAAIDLSGTDLTKGYDYNALILKTPDGARAYDPRYGMADLFQDGLHAYATVTVPVLTRNRLCLFSRGAFGLPLFLISAPACRLWTALLAGF